MKTVLKLFLISCFLLPACISFSIRPPDLPDNLLEEMTLGKSVNVSKDPWYVTDISSSFSLQDGSLVCFVKIRYVEQEIRLRWKWYSPQNSVAKDTGDVIVNSDRQYLDEVTAYDTFRFKPESETAGKWIVAFFIDNTLAGKRAFVISKEE